MSFGCDALAIIADAEPKLLLVIADFHFDALRSGVTEGVAHRFADNPVDFIAQNRMQVARRAFHLHSEIRPAAVGRCKFFTKRSNRQCQIVTLHRRCAQPLHGIPPLDNRLLGLIDNAFESLFGRTAWKLVGKNLKVQQNPVEALQQSVVQIAGDTCAFADARLQRHVELMMQLPDAQLVGAQSNARTPAAHRARNQVVW